MQILFAKNIKFAEIFKFVETQGAMVGLKFSRLENIYILVEDIYVFNIQFF